MDEFKWSPTIGDPTLMGWFTVVAYFATSWLCWRASRGEARVAQRAGAEQPSRWWTFLFVVLVALGINKQLDLQTLLTELAKVTARMGGWYEERRVVQVAFIGLVGLFGAAGLVLTWWLTRREGRAVRLALLGLVFLSAFIVVRAASFHHVDILLRLGFNWLLELGGIGIIAAGALWRTRQLSASRSSVPPSEVERQRMERRAQRRQTRSV